MKSQIERISERESSATLRGSSDLPGSTVTLVQATRVLGRYVIEQPIGAGGMGEVYRARDTRLERIVAIKMLPRDAAAPCGIKIENRRVNGSGAIRKRSNAPSSWRMDIADTKPIPIPARTASFTPSTPAISSATRICTPARAQARSTNWRTPDPPSRNTSE